MNKVNIKKYEDRLAEKTNEYVNFLNVQTGQIDLPQATQAEIPTPRPGNTGTIMKVGIGVGVLTAALGLATKSTAVTISGGLVAVACAISMAKTANGNRAEPLPATDFSALTLSIYKKLEETHRHIFSEWDEYLGKLKDELKKEISALDADNATKNKMTEIALNRSVIEFNMPAVLSSLSKIEEKHDTDIYRQYIEEFRKEYEQAIRKAFSEQAARYREISDCLAE